MEVNHDMSGQINLHPIKWSVNGNIAPLELSKPDNIQVFAPYKCQLQLQNEIIIDKILLKPIQITEAME
jgi:hypothetical protein